jgi:hypothetical protein
MTGDDIVHCVSIHSAAFGVLCVLLVLQKMVPLESGLNLETAETFNLFNLILTESGAPFFSFYVKKLKKSTNIIVANCSYFLRQNTMQSLLFK